MRGEDALSVKIFFFPSTLCRHVVHDDVDDGLDLVKHVEAETDHDKDDDDKDDDDKDGNKRDEDEDEDEDEDVDVEQREKL